MAVTPAQWKNDARKRRQFWRAFGATFIALVLWGILSLSQTYTWDIDVPLTVQIDTTRQALAVQVPTELQVTARGDGWTLMQVATGSALRSIIDPAGHLTNSDDSTRVFAFNERDIISSINAPSSIRIERVQPDNLRVTITDLVAKRVPLYYPDITIQTRAGFQVIGKPRVRPDSVRLSGSVEALENIAYWFTKPLSLQDVFASTRTAVPVSDSLQGVINVIPEEAIVTVDVQEIAEVTFEDLPVLNRSTNSDTNLQLRYFPDRITVTLRGGAEELGRLKASHIVPQIELVAGVDTSGFARPKIGLPKEFNASIINVVPERIRYIWRRSVPAKPGDERKER